jgi:hypothetical protein
VRPGERTLVSPTQGLLASCLSSTSGRRTPRWQMSIERLVFLAKIDAGLGELAGRGVPHDDVKRRVSM